MDENFKVLPPKEASFNYKVGWLFAELHIQNEGDLDQAPSHSWGAEKIAGFENRIQLERNSRPQPVRFHRK